MMLVKQVYSRRQSYGERSQEDCTGHVELSEIKHASSNDWSIVHCSIRNSVTCHQRSSHCCDLSETLGFVKRVSKRKKTE
jgi:hypothetical protein